MTLNIQTIWSGQGSPRLVVELSSQIRSQNNGFRWVFSAWKCLAVGLLAIKSVFAICRYVFNNGEFRVTDCHVAGIYPCWDVGSPAAITLTP